MGRRLFILVALLACASCSGEKRSSARSTEPAIAAVNYPLAYFAERMAGHFATIVFDCPPGEDPAHWVPTDEQITRMQQADVILLNGAGYAKWPATASLPRRKLQDTSIAFRDRWIRIENAVTHTHGKDGKEHSHAGTASTTWLDLTQALLQATTAKGAIVRAFPDRKSEIEQNFARLKADLESIDASFREAANGLKDVPVLTSHPYYQYFARAYGLRAYALAWMPEKTLDADSTTGLELALHKMPGAKHFIWEAPPLPESIATLEKYGLGSVVVRPCAHRPESGDFLSVMQENVTALSRLNGS